MRSPLSLAVALALGLSAPVLAQTWNPADVLGPDGIVYPDWTRSGVPGGIPSALPACAAITSHGAVANDGLDDTAALEAAAEACGQAGGGVVSLPAGTFHLDRPAFIRRSHVALRGAGRSATKLVFRFAPPSNNVAFFLPPGISNQTLANNHWLEIHADPKELQRLTIKAGGQVVTQKLRSSGHWGASFSLRTNGSSLAAKAGHGTGRQIVAEAEYPGGVVRTRTLTVTLENRSDANAIPGSGHLSAINFLGAGRTGGTFLLDVSGLRGDTQVTLPPGHTVVAGDHLEIFAPATAAWNAEVRNACTTSTNFRRYQVRATSVSGQVVTLNQPLRIDFPKADGSYVQKMLPLTGNGVEDLSLEQTNDVWTSGILFAWSWGSWAKNVHVKKAGRFPLYFNPGKFCEIRDSVFDDAWFKGDGGTAYVGFEYAYDCMMDGVTTYKMRHAPLVQWSAAGNVVRRSTFVDSDAQWHAGWTNENLFEQVTVEANRGHGAYGYGMWASPPEDTAHGPNGPRNVVYNSDVTSPKAGVWLGGMNRGWVFAYNRIHADTGVGVFAKDNSGGHVLADNVFVLGASGSGVRLETSDCTGVALTGNHFQGLTGPESLSSGQATPAVLRDNTTDDTFVPAGFTNPGFESGWTGWTREASDSGMSVLSASAARTGGSGLRVTDGSSTLGSSVLSPAFPVQPGGVYGVRYWQRILSGGSGGMGVYLRFYDAAGREVASYPHNLASGSNWQRVLHRDTAPAGSVTARVWLHSYSHGVLTVDFDDFEFGALPHELPNGGFETGLSQWDASGDNGMSVASGSAAHSGGQGLRVSDASTSLGSSLASARFPAQPGWTYQVRYWARQTSGSGIAVYLQFFDANLQQLASPLKQLPAEPAWREYTLRADAPAGTAFVRVWLHSYAAAQVTADFDDLVFAALPPRPRPAVASIFEWQRNPVFPLTNPGFESGVVGWNLSGDLGQSVATSAAARSGTAGLRVTDTSTSGQGSSAWSEPFFVQPGKSYRVAFWSRLVSGSGLGVYLRFYDASGAELSAAAGNLTVPAGTTAWKAFQLDRPAPANAATARIWIHSYIADVVTADLDDVSFRRL